MRTLLSKAGRGALAAAVAGTALLAPAATSAAACDPKASDLGVRYAPVDHTVGGTDYYRARITLANRGEGCSLGSNWALYFNFVRQPLAVYPPGALGDAARAELAAQGLELRRADAAQSGDYYVLEPTSSFAPIGPGEERAIDLNVELWAILKTDAPAGWHIAFDGGPAHWVPARVDQDAGDPKQTTAWEGDKNPVETAATRFAANTAPKLRLNLAERLVPRPLDVDERSGSLWLGGRHLTIGYEGGLAGEARYLASALGDVLRHAPATHRGTGFGDDIELRRNAGLDVDDDGAVDDDAYRMRIAPAGVRIVGADGAGVLYGIQTLRQLVSPRAYEAAARGHQRRAVRLPRVRIADAPLFGYRGLQIDVARHFETPRTIKKFLDLMAFLKMNRLHFHVTDDEGWRIEIPGLPELTSFAARRGFDVDEDRMLHQAMGSGNDLRPGDNVLDKPANEREANLGRDPAYQGFEQATLNYVGKGSGYYRVADLRDILAHATKRHIQVIPEFDFPAHARAAVQAMERRYRRLAAGDPAAASQYRLLDPDDGSQHHSVQGYTDNLVNPCIESTYRFLDKVVREVKRIYDDAGAPLTMINLGGDEAPGPDRWQGSPLCQSNPETAGMSDKQLMDRFFTRWNAIAQTVAPRTAGWEDVILAGTGNLTLPNFVPLPWQNVWGWGREQEAYKFANRGTPVVLAHATNLYMDLAYNKDPDEPGYYWANFVDEKKTFTYQPFDVYSNATEDRWGSPFTPGADWERLTPQGRKNILGMELELWGENGKTPEIREYQAFPKLLGGAERAWNRDTPTPAEMPEAWNVFVNTLGQSTFPLLSFYQPVGQAGIGVNYRIPLPGGRIEHGVLTANVRNPGLKIEYSTGNGSWSTYRGPVRVGDHALLRTVAPDRRTSRISLVGS
jgi:hexosaminidase